MKHYKGFFGITSISITNKIYIKLELNLVYGPDISFFGGIICLTSVGMGYREYFSVWGGRYF